MFGVPHFADEAFPKAALVRPFHEDSFSFDGVLYRLKELRAILPTEEDQVVQPGKPTMSLTQAVFRKIITELCKRTPEVGGLLIGPKDTELVTHFLFDRNGKSTSVTFTLDHVGLNSSLKLFVACDLEVKGIVHSHPSGCRAPSSGDLVYVHRLWSNPKNSEETEFLLPIVCDGHFYPYLVRRDDDRLVVRSAQLLLA